MLCCVHTHLEGEVGNIDQLVVREREQVEETQLGEGSRLDFFHTVVVDHKLLQRGQTIKRLLQSQETKDLPNPAS